MAQKIREVMTPAPVTLPQAATVTQAAIAMRDEGIGDVLVLRETGVYGLVTDRDIVVRTLAENRDPLKTTLGEICSEDLATVSADDDASAAVHVMRERAVRRVPVMDEEDQAVGIVSIGDLARERDPRSALADVSTVPPNN
jgi:CBS domain-containing protein